MSFSARTGSLIALGVALVFAGVVRARLLSAPFERDEGEYAVMGQLLLRGEPPFRSVWNMKLPGTAMAYAASMAVFGETVEGARSGVLVATLLTVVLLFLLGRALFGNVGGAAAAAAHATLALSPALLGPFGHATHFVALFGTAGLLSLALAFASARPLARVALAGLCFGLATLMKQPGAAFGAFGALWLAFERKGAWPQLAREAAALVAAAVLPLAAVAGWTAAAGTFHTFWFWVVEYARAYSGEVGLAQAGGVLAGMLSSVVPPNAALCLLALGALASPRRGFLLGLFALSFAGVSAGLYFRAHYFLMLLPALALMVGAAAQALATRFSEWGSTAAAAAVATCCATTALMQGAHLFVLSPPAVVASLYGANPFPEMVELGRRIRESSTPEDTIGVLGSEPELFFYARRRPASGYLYVYPLMEDQPYALKMQQEMISQLEKARPLFVVLCEVKMSWLAGPKSQRMILDWAEPWLSEHYEQAGRVQIQRPDLDGTLGAPVTLYRRRD
jgi:hypothetical protein